MSGRLYLLGVGLALAALAFIVTDALLWEPRATEMNCRRLREGMTFGEVVAILGEHPLKDQADPGESFVLLVWHGDEGTASVVFDKGRAVKLRWFEAVPRTNLFARLRAWLGL